MFNWSTVQLKVLIERNHLKVKMLIIRLVYLSKLSSNMFHDFISNKVITWNDKDPPWQLNDQIRQILNKKKELFKQFINNRKL